MSHANAITPAAYLAACKQRFGVANPERIVEPVWEWMVRENHGPYSARKSLGLEQDYSGHGGKNADWCFERMGMPVVKMNDGRLIFIAGEHEDFYDPHFCIFNDVVVRRGDEVEIYAYPREVFPPTDFHSATLVGNAIWIIGSLGYTEERGAVAQVFALDTTTYQMRRELPTGDSPGWIRHHNARLLDDGFTIEIRGGKVIRKETKGQHERRNTDVFWLNTRTGEWSKKSDTSSWRQFRIDYDRKQHGLETMPWHTGEVLRELGYPLEVWQEPEDDDDEDRERVHTLTVERVPVRIIDDYRSIHVTIEGVISPPGIESLLEGLKRLLAGTGGSVKRHTEC